MSNLVRTKHVYGYLIQNGYKTVMDILFPKIKCTQLKENLNETKYILTIALVFLQLRHLNERNCFVLRVNIERLNIQLQPAQQIGSILRRLKEIQLISNGLFPKHNLADQSINKWKTNQYLTFICSTRQVVIV